APRGQKRVQDAWQWGMTQVAIAMDFWYSSQCHEEHASWQWGQAMVALASAIARPSLLTWPLPLAPGHQKNAITPSLTPERWPPSPSVDRPTVRAQARAAEPNIRILHAECGAILFKYVTLFSSTFQSFFGYIVGIFNSSLP